MSNVATKPFPIVRIEWVDSELQGTWHDRQRDFSLATIISVGQLIQKTREHYVLALNYDSKNDMINNRSTIPCCAVRHFGIIKEEG